ncbi:MAG: 50S ribosomal protein L20 [Acidobacteriota bacterium]
MPRVTRGNKKLLRRKKILKLAKGFFGTKKSNYRTAKEAVEKSLTYAYRDRRNKKRDFRKLWNIRINAAVREHDLNYSKFINGLKKADIILNRKVLSNLAISDPETFKLIVDKAKASL